MRYFRALLALSLLSLSTPAWAHTAVVSLSPAKGASLSVAPTQVLITADAEVQDMGTAITVTSPLGARVDDGSTEVEGKLVLIGLKSLTEVGTYTVNYRLLAQDGHALDGTYEFSLTTASSPSPTPTQAPVVPVNSDSNQWLSIALIVAALSSLLLLIRRFRR